MDLDTLYKSIFFGGLYGVTFWLIYRAGRKTAPKLAIWYSVGSWVALMAIMLIGSGLSSALLFIPAVIVSLFVFRQKADSSLQGFFTANRIYKASVVPEPVSQLLGSTYYSCAEGTLATQSGEEVRYNWWQGLTSSMVMSGKTYITTFNYFLAISFAPSVVSEEFKRVARAKTETSGFTFRQKFRRFFVLDTETPIRVEETPDGSFVIVWQTFHDVQRFSHYVNWLKENLSANKPEVVVDPEPAKTESFPQPVIPSTRTLHESAVGQSPKANAYSRSHLPRS
jgi:hypothetical protein